jgi:hypothetical protein
MFCCVSTIAYAVVLTKRTFSRKTDGLPSVSISVPKAHINGVKFDLRVRARARWDADPSGASQGAVAGAGIAAGKQALVRRTCPAPQVLVPCYKEGTDVVEATLRAVLMAELPHNTTRCVLPGLAWPGLAWPGLAWPGLAWPGLAWPGLAWPAAPSCLRAHLVAALAPFQSLPDPCRTVYLCDDGKDPHKEYLCRWAGTGPGASTCTTGAAILLRTDGKRALLSMHLQAAGAGRGVRHGQSQEGW